jgi:TetR/AcrR family transcriptional repressor of nem operon
MRYDKAHKEKTRRRVLQAAAKAIRLEGPHRVGVAAVMAKAGLTHGGFYAHFESKDDLIASAIGQMFDELVERLEQRVSEQPPNAALRAFIEHYLSLAHRDAVATGCPIPVLAPELRRIGRPARQRFSEGVAKITEIIADRLRVLGRAEPETDASSMMAELIGALSLSRAEPDPQRSAMILEGSRRALLSRFRLNEHAGLS